MGKINHQMTKENIFQDGRTIIGWSRRHNLNAETVKQFFYGRFVSKSGEGVYGQIIEALEKDGYLVVENQALE